MPDYVRLQQTAKRQIEKNGREISVVKLAESEEEDETPWRGTVKPRVEPDKSFDTHGVFVPISSTSYLGIEFTFKQDNVARGQQIALVPAVDAEDDLLAFDEIHDDGSIWKIVNSQVLKPGALPILYAFEVKQ